MGIIKGILSFPGKGIWLGKWRRFGRPPSAVALLPRTGGGGCGSPGWWRTPCRRTGKRSSGSLPYSGARPSPGQRVQKGALSYLYVLRSCVLSCFRCNLVSGYESYRMSVDAPGTEAITEHKTVLWACKRPLQGKHRLKTFPIRHENPPSGKHRTQHH